MEDRKLYERDFHNQIRSAQDAEHVAHDSKAANKRFYFVTGASIRFIDAWLEANCADATVLDYCCGNGDNSIRIAKMTRAKKCVGIDISDISVENAKKRAKAQGVADKTEFLVADAENTKFPDDSFDIIICAGVLHHLDIRAAFPELARILKPSGKIIAIEALNINPIFHLYRKLTPELRTEWETEHILGPKDLTTAAEHFAEMSVDYFHLAAVPCAFLLPIPTLFKPMLALANLIDAVLMKIPGINRLAWQMVFVLSNPKKGR